MDNRERTDSQAQAQASIIVVDDDQRMARMLRRNLNAAGFQVSLAANGRELRNAYRHRQPDLVLLDLNLEVEDGIDLAVELVAATSAAIIIITGRDELNDRVKGLDAGADDYIIKPFDIDELLARIRAVLRRRSLELPQTNQLELGPFCLDRTARTFCRVGSPPTCITLTETEVRILSILILHNGRVVSREQLMSREIKSPVDRSIDVHIGNIRRKLKQSKLNDIVIWPVRGFGYRLRLEP
ncbi:DNA-binding response regulator [Lamprobacter modestohalophilus]|uniref:DNA-binding response regulator n=1 Tax=Lamprobacter modestohalophilus TaxID=1064514 RepID=A0A9X1B6K8_9GAMM|nr:response regulator transcription factor [Lamprobacter modestohalophilus]MBK1620986.1 DNA-binding response regulator [Lamprobacter modestohalophilus]